MKLASKSFKMLALIATLLCPVTHAQTPGEQEPQLHDAVIWKGKNGKAIRANYMVERDGVIDVMEVASNRILQLKRETLSEETLDWYLRARARAEGTNKVAGQQGGAKPEAAADPRLAKTTAGTALALLEPPPGFEAIDTRNLTRTMIPALDQSKYGHKASDCVPNAYAMSFMWWDEHSNLKIPRGRDFDDKAQWIHKELARAFGTRNNSGTYYRDVDSGFVKFFERRYKETATYKAHREIDVRPASLAPYVTGGSCAVLCLSVFHDDSYEYGHAVSVLNLKEDGRIEFNTWGHKFTGRIVSLGPLEANERTWGSSAPRERYEILLDPSNNIPQWMKDRKHRFLIDPTRWDNLHIIVPFVKKET